MKNTNSLSFYGHMAERLLEDTFGFYFYGVEKVDDEKMFFYDKYKETTLEITNMGHEKTEEGNICYYNVSLKERKEEKNYIAEFNDAIEDVWDVIEDAVNELKKMYNEHETKLMYYYGNGY